MSHSLQQNPHRFRSLSLVGILVGALVWWWSGPAGASSDYLTEALTERLQGDSSGACLAAAHLRYSGPEPNVTTGFVCAEADTPLPTADSRFEVGSLSKVMQGMVLARLYQAGQLDVNTPVLALLPEEISVSEETVGPITLAQLLTHSAGLPRLPPLLDPADPDDPYADFTPEQLYNSLAQVQLQHVPGTAFTYSNFGAMLLGELVARQQGVPLAELFADWLFAPAGMKSASFTGETVQGYSYLGEPVGNWSFPDNMAGVGGVRASLNDMIALVEFLLAPEDAQVRQAMTMALEPVFPELNQPVAWGPLVQEVAGRQLHVHDGGTGGFTSMLALDVNHGEAIVLLANGAIHQTGGLQQLALHLLGFDQPPGEPHRSAAQPEHLQLQDFTGTYPLFPGFELSVFVQEQQLHIQATGQPAAPIYYVGDDTFENRTFGARFVFARNDEGEVTAVELHQHGQVLQGEREVH